MKYLWLELYKLKHRKVFLTFLVILGVELLFVFSNYGNNKNFLNMVSDPAAPAWEDLIIGPAAINGLFFPILAAVIASRICDMEHKGNTWKLLECNNQNRKTIWFCKFTIVSTLMMLAIFIQAFTIIAYGNSVGIVQTLPVRTLLGFVLGTAMITFVVVTIQVFFSLVCTNQLVPMSIGMVGALIGFISTLLPPGIRNILIWGNYAELMVLGQDTSSGNLQSSGLVVRNINFIPLVILFVVGLVAYVVFRKRFEKYEY
ncbi:ABC transporter permease [bacterium C-53]|nr:ABC transporter permease [Lachnospiraceae bacterium]NBI02943.1 ABC transporter permease [Lachnospiraceae bacterium]RKJ11066.1 ABC transporter permease [bacterium C-53]